MENPRILIKFVEVFEKEPSNNVILETCGRGMYSMDVPNPRSTQ